MLSRFLPVPIARRLGLSRPEHLPRRCFPDDVYLVSYPRSGNTWVRFLLGNYLSGNQCRFSNCHEIVPDVHFDRSACDKVARPRIIKSHMPFVGEYQRVIYLVRDVRDVAVSYYYFQLKYGNISPDRPFADFLHDFSAGAVDGLGNWSHHVRSWLDRSPGRFLLLRYEDLRQSPAEGLEQMLRFAGLDCDEARIHAAVEAASFNNMRSLESQDHDRFRGLAGSDRGVRFVRSGQTGGKDPLLTEPLRQQILRIHGPMLARLGYLEQSAAGSSAA